MDNEKLYRHIVVIMQNIYRINVCYEYAITHLDSLIAELETTEEQEKWIRYKDTLMKSIDLDGDINLDWEKELERYEGYG